MNKNECLRINRGRGRGSNNYRQILFFRRKVPSKWKSEVTLLDVKKGYKWFVKKARIHAKKSGVMTL